MIMVANIATHSTDNTLMLACVCTHTLTYHVMLTGAYENDGALLEIDRHLTVLPKVLKARPLQAHPPNTKLPDDSEGSAVPSPSPVACAAVPATANSSLSSLSAAAAAAFGDGGENGDAEIAAASSRGHQGSRGNKRRALDEGAAARGSQAQEASCWIWRE
jgi:hypothetical protein